MTNKKVIAVVVEGQSDATALQDYLSSLFTEGVFEFAVSSGDFLSTDEDCEEDLEFLLENRAIFRPDVHRDFEAEDLFAVIHIIDTDGVFISDENVWLDPNLSYTHYFDDHIVVTKNVARTNELRYNRRDRIEECLKTKNVRIRNVNGIPYFLYYMSCNLEHVTQGERNVEMALDKIDLAMEFASRFPNENEFIQFLIDNNASHTEDYQESWSYIKRHSLDRATNLIIFIRWLKQEEQVLKTRKDDADE